MQAELAAKEALAILAATVLEFDGNGRIPDKLANSHPAVMWALREAQHAHAWVVCGPDSDAMGRLMFQKSEVK